MVTRTDFTPEQWSDLLAGPAQAAGLMILGDPSNPFKMVGEAMAGGTAYREGLASASTPVMQAIAAELNTATPEELRERIKTDQKYDSIEAMQKDSVYRLQRTMELVRAKGGDEDAEAYAKFIMHVAGKVANAAKEGGFLGIGGTTISEREQQLLDELRNTLGV